MKYYTFDKYSRKIAARQWEITLDGQKSEQWIFVNTNGSQPIMRDFLPFFMDYDNGDDLFFVRLLFVKDLVKEYYKTHKSNKNLEIIKKEIELDVLFPNDFESILNHTKKFEIPEGFFMLTLEEILSVGTGENFWQDFTPRAIKAVGIASDAGGDYIGYILEEDSDIQLSSELIIFNHETGTIEELE